MGLSGLWALSPSVGSFGISIGGRRDAGWDGTSSGWAFSKLFHGEGEKANQWEEQPPTGPAGRCRRGFQKGVGCTAPQPVQWQVLCPGLGLLR